MKTLGQKIRELREEKDVSLRELAKSIQISPAFLSDVELGRRFPSDKILLSIAQTLEVPLDELQVYDTRLPVKDLKRLANTDPTYGFAFRKVINTKITPQDLLDLVKKKSKIKKS